MFRLSCPAGHFSPFFLYSLTHQTLLTDNFAKHFSLKLDIIVPSSAGNPSIKTKSGQLEGDILCGL